jgi:biopolymer transport protein ExbB
LNNLRALRPAIMAAALIGLCWCFSAFGADAPATTAPAAAESSGPFGGAFEWFVKGGPVMYPIALTSLVGLAFIIERGVALRRLAVIPLELQENLVERIDDLDVAGAIALCEENDSALARVAKAALLRRSGTIQEMEKAGEDASIHELWQLRRNIRPINIVASLSPLLGLLGTISGMIGAFEIMSTGDSMGNPGAFAGAIREALFTTFFGLSVAIPMVPSFHWLHGKAQALIAEINETTGDLLLRLRDRKLQDEGAAQ